MGLVFLSAAAHAQEPDFAGKWSVVGDIAAGRGTMVVMSTCTFTQAGNALTGNCDGPNETCDMIGAARNWTIDWTCRTVKTDQPSSAGVMKFRGVVGNDYIVRGKWSHSRLPRRHGYFYMVRV